MRAAAAQIAVERGANLAVIRIGIDIEQCFCRHQDAAGAVAALRGLLGDERALQRVQRAFIATERTQCFDGRYFLPTTADTGTSQDCTALPSMITVQVPHWPIPQP